MGVSSLAPRTVRGRQSWSARYFARRVVYPWELPSIMRKHIYTGAMGSTYYALINGIFFVYFGNSIGMSRFQWGVMGGIASFVLTAQLLSAVLTQRSGRRKVVWFASAIAARGLRILGILVSLWLWHTGWVQASVVLIAFICLSNFFGAMAEPPWLSWLADIIPERDHGRFWGRRSAWIALSVACAVIPAGLLMDWVPEARKLIATTVVFGGAAVIGFIDLFIHGTIPEPPMAMPRQGHFLSHLLAPIRDCAFRPWLTFNVCWTFGMTFGGALSTLYFVDELGMKKHFLGGVIVLTALPFVGSILTGRWSGRLVDRLGPRRVLYWGHLFWASLPAFWLFASPGVSALILLGFSSLLGGTSSAAAVNAATKLITRLPPAAERAMYVAVSSCLGNVAGGLGVLAAGTVLHALEHWHWEVWGWTLVGFHVLFLGSLLLRFGSALTLIRRVRDPVTQPADPQDP